MYASSFRLLASSRSVSAAFCRIQFFMFSMLGRRSSSRFDLVLANEAASLVLFDVESLSISAPSTSRGWEASAQLLGRILSTHRPLDRIPVHFEYLEKVESGQIRRKSVETIVGNRKNFEIREAAWCLGEGVNLVLGQIENLQGHQFDQLRQ